MHTVRWWLYKKTCWLGWHVCPEPERHLIGISYDAALALMKLR